MTDDFPVPECDSCHCPMGMEETRRSDVVVRSTEPPFRKRLFMFCDDCRAEVDVEHLKRHGLVATLQSPVEHP